jgi:hypothetical protein
MGLASGGGRPLLRRVEKEVRPPEDLGNACPCGAILEQLSDLRRVALLGISIVESDGGTAVVRERQYLAGTACARSTPTAAIDADAG